MCSCFSLIHWNCMFKQLWRVAEYRSKGHQCSGDYWYWRMLLERLLKLWDLALLEYQIFPFLFPILFFFWTPPNTNTFFFLGINTEFRDEPITLLDTSFLLSIGWSRVSISRDNLPKMMVHQHFTIYRESFKRHDFKWYCGELQTLLYHNCTLGHIHIGGSLLFIPLDVSFFWMGCNWAVCCLHYV